MVWRRRCDIRRCCCCGESGTACSLSRDSLLMIFSAGTYAALDGGAGLAPAQRRYPRKACASCCVRSLVWVGRAPGVNRQALIWSASHLFPMRHSSSSRGLGRAVGACHMAQRPPGRYISHRHRSIRPVNPSALTCVPASTMRADVRRVRGPSAPCLPPDAGHACVRSRPARRQSDMALVSFPREYHRPCRVSR
jgi:hypothetical protein